MYQAIVFLPLLGAIIAGADRACRRRRRHPGGEPGRAPHGDHAAIDHAASPCHADHDETVAQLLPPARMPPS